MGNWTRVHLEIELNKNLPEELAKWFNSKKYGGIREEYTPVYEHEFFRSERWEFVGSGSSAYHPYKPYMVFNETDEGYFLATSFQLKHFDNEVEKFLHMLSPFMTRNNHVLGTLVGDHEYAEPSGDPAEVSFDTRSLPAIIIRDDTDRIFIQHVQFRKL